MKTTHFAAFLAVLVLLATGASAQDRHDQQFNDHDKTVAQDWYNQHQNESHRGLRSSDRLTAAEEQRLQPGRPLDRDLRSRAHAVPEDLGRQLPPAPRHHQYLAVGLHIALVDSRDHTVRDVIHLHEH